MKLYAFPVAPNPTKVRLYIAEKRQAGGTLDVEEVRVDLPKGEQKSPEHLARDPLGKLPVLETNEGVFLTESLPMILYLEELYPDPPMIGRSPLGLPPNPPVAEAFRQSLPTAFGLLDQRLADGRPFLMGEAPTIADCTLAAGLQFGRMGKLDIDEEYTHLRRWSDAYRARGPATEVLVL